MTAIAETLGKQVGLKRACAVLNIPRSRVYRARQPQVASAQRPSPAALSSDERDQVRQTLNSARFADKAPRQVYASLLDEGVYLCHWRTMYRVLAAHDEVRERRNLLTHPAYSKPELLATAPTRSGRGTSPPCAAPASGKASICMCCWTSTAAAWSGG